ncbi:uncharacterized protein NDAI_0K00140 [Naumovozyma dairenensis CBS 421]|uniref:RNase III domain-containing protein n=1 Tax=Naumovozyma dairenensis (strain ATCC 10597 / BCRC 20456 / CBS 421 / NBRC 0211 / NRRL Y-12639) TaxID=1071378 RepID=G0WHE2_NAUDC|nr:hypothetical protein NDAI_0K00140 [Naumovozyma dairenensis CBS 421]CCD27203.1 hypothetical protein NDAI_0K00140 [Naumovozyma dairenensis CBS 421]
MDTNLIPLDSPYEEKDARNLRNFYKLQNACATLNESIKVIYEYSPSFEEREYMTRNGNPLEQTIANSPAVHVANYLTNMRNSFDLEAIFKAHHFENGKSPVDKFISYPVCTDPNLEHLAFIHKSLPNMNVRLTELQKTIMSNERLEFLGDSWLGAFIAFIIYKKYPYANEGALSKMKDAIVNNNNLEKLSEKLGFKERLKENIPRSSMKIKDRLTKHYADCVEAYIGALVVDRFATEFKDVSDWLEELSTEHFENLGPLMFREPLNRNAKGELGELLQFNNIGAKINYTKLTENSPFSVEVYLGDIFLGKGDGPNIREAEQRAAMAALADHALIQKYSSYDIEVDKKYLGGSNASNPALSTDSPIDITEVDNDNRLETSVKDVESIQEHEYMIPNQLNNSYEPYAAMTSQKHHLTPLEKQSQEVNKKPQEFTLPVDNQPQVEAAPLPPVTSSNVDQIMAEVMQKMSTMMTSMVSETVSEVLKKSMPVASKPTLPSLSPLAIPTANADSQLHKAHLPSKATTGILPPPPMGTTPLVPKPSSIGNGIVPPPPGMAPLPQQTPMHFHANRTSGASSFSSSAPGNRNESYDKEASGKLYAMLGKIGLYPEYIIEQLSIDHFVATCNLKGLGIHLGTGEGRSKNFPTYCC